MSFEAPEMIAETVTITEDYVAQKLSDILEDENLSRYIL
jgi:ATP-dependent HslUV protease ATP-binding subunit HslU